jgi:RNA polymerase sigma factor (sigma-70 family)
MAARRVQGSATPIVDAGARAAAVVARHEAALLRVARHFSLCHDDALDAYQRALEIYVRRVDTVDPETELGWLKVVVRHEAMAIRRARSEAVAGEELDLDAIVPAPERSVEDKLASDERVRRSAEALRALKPDEAQALMMKAHGLSYDEIGKRQGWSYTNVMATIAVFLALGGVSYALTLPRNSVGSRQLRSDSVGRSEVRQGAITSSAIANRSIRLRDVSRSARSSLTGSPGPPGPPGPPGVTLFGSVNALGESIRGNITGSNQSGINGRLISFNRPVGDCVSTATLATVPGANPTAPPPTGHVTVAPTADGRVLVQTWAANGAAQALPFNIIVAC